jgi:hypothetical protein
MILTGLALSACTSNEPLVAPPKAAPQTRSELPPTKEAPAPVAPEERWVPQADDVLGHWKKTCAPAPGGPPVFAVEEVHFADSKVVYSISTYPDASCSEASRLTLTPIELAFESWEEETVMLGNLYVKGWKGEFINEAREPKEVLEAIAYLVMESGEKVLYLNWAAKRPAALDASKERYVFAGY